METNVKHTQSILMLDAVYWNTYCNVLSNAPHPY